MFPVDDFKLIDDGTRRRLRNTIWKRSVYCEKWVGINAANVFNTTAEKISQWADDNTLHEAVSAIFGKSEVNVLNVNRQDRSERNKYNEIEIDADTVTKNFSNKAPIKAISDTKLSTANLYKTYKIQGDRDAFETNDIFDRKFGMFQNKFDEITLKTRIDQRHFPCF